MKFQSDFTGAIKKTKAALNIPRAARFQLTKWTSEAVRAVKQSAMNMKKSGRKTSQLARNIGSKTEVEGSTYKTVIGTGVGSAKSVVYARIQEEGGTIKPRRRKFLTVPLPGIMGVASNYPDAFCIRSKAGNLLIVERKGKDGIRPLFVLKKQVTLPATHWFSRPLSEKLPMLKQMMEEGELFKVAQRLGEKGGA